ncbi:MAG: hypothetical protein IJ344_03610, partial [Clostridia bacterium]|nr:hypothetical protein [Clostridia bacterium]
PMFLLCGKVPQFLPALQAKNAKSGCQTSPSPPNDSLAHSKFLGSTPLFTKRGGGVRGRALQKGVFLWQTT